MDSAFEEFILKRCEEVLKIDETYNQLNKSVSEKELELINKLSIDQKTTYNMLEDENIKMISYLMLKMYRLGFNDRIDLR